MIIEVLKDLVNDTKNTVTDDTVTSIDDNKKTITRALLNKKTMPRKLKL